MKEAVEIMSDIENTTEKKQVGDKLLDYVQELVMLNFVYEQELITKDEMYKIRNDIMKSYGIKGRII